MSNEFLIYLVGNIDSINESFGVIGSLILCVSILGFVLVVSEETIKNRWHLIPLSIAMIGATMVLIAIFTPNSKTLAAMILIPKIIENERVIDIGDKTATVLEKKLDSWLEEITEKNNKSEGE